MNIREIFIPILYFPALSYTGMQVPSFGRTGATASAPLHNTWWFAPMEARRRSVRGLRTEDLGNGTTYKDGGKTRTYRIKFGMEAR